MAQVKEISKDGLKRAYTVVVAQDVIQKNLTARLKEIGKTAQMPGFRAGKIPMPVLVQRYGSSARAEVLDQTVSDVTDEAIKEHNLRPAMQPKIELVSFAEDKDLEFKLELEILPDVTIGDFSNISLERFVADVEDKVIEEAITRAAKSMREPVVVNEKRAAVKGDVLVIDFDGTVDGVAQPGMKGQDHRLELGSKTFIDTFEEQLIGAHVGDTPTIKVTFPEDYHATNLAGKQAEFRVTVKELREPKPLEMNDALAVDLGFESLEKLRARVKEDIAEDYQRISRTIIKRQLMDQLAASYKFEIPASMLDNEFTTIWQQVEASRAKGELPEEDKKKSDSELRKEYQDIAERRIRLGLLLAEVAQKNNISVVQTELRNALMTEARRFPGQEKAVFDYYTKTQGAMERLRAPLLEEKVIDHILAQAKVSEKKIDADALMKMPQED